MRIHGDGSNVFESVRWGLDKSLLLFAWSLMMWNAVDCSID